jgi:hypothetical protein
MDTRKTVVPAALLLALVSSGFSASLYAVDYTYVEGRFLFDVDVDADTIEDDGDGFRIGGSYLVTPEFFAFGQYADISLDDSDIDMNSLSIGGGYIHSINATWDANATLSLVKLDAEGPGGDEDETGFALAGGVRGMVKPQIELRAFLTYANIDESDTYITLGGDYYFMPNVSAGFELDMAGDIETFSIGAKYYF